MRTRRLFAAAAIGMGLMSVSAFATQITQTFTVPAGTTLDISSPSGTGTFNKFLTECPSCSSSWLTSVQFQIAVTGSMDTLTVTNTSTGSNTFRYISYVSLTMDGTAANADKNAIKSALNSNGGSLGNIDLINTGNLTYTAGETKTFAPPAVTVTDDSGLINAASNTPYNSTGTFTLGFETLTFQSFVGGGGNGKNSQTTTAGATINVIYNYTDPTPPSATPEPTTMVLFGSALVGIGLMRRKVQSRS